MNCTKKYKKCSCKWCKNITKRRAKPCEKAVWDKFNNGIKRLFEEPPPPLPPPPPPHLGNFKANRFEFYMGKILASIRYEEQKITDLKEYIDIFQGGHYTFCGTTIAKLVGKVIKRRLPPGDVTKKKVLKVMRSDPELKKYKEGAHEVYYEITSKPPVDFDNDILDIITDVEKMIKFYWEWRP